MDRVEELKGVIARTFCTDRNKHKILDAELMEDIITAILNAGYRKPSKIEPLSTKDFENIVNDTPEGREAIANKLDELIEVYNKGGGE